MQLQSLLAPEMLRIMLFRNAEGRGLLWVRHILALRTQLKGVLKSPGNLSRTCVCRVFWPYSYVQTFSGADCEISGIQGNWHIYDIHVLPSQRATPVVVGPPSIQSILGIFFSVPFLTGEEVTSRAREVCSYISWNLFPVGTCWDAFLV